MARRQERAARGRGQRGVCAQDLRLGQPTRLGRYYKMRGWNARTGGGRCRRRKVLSTHRRSSSRRCFFPFLQSPTEHDVPGGALGAAIRSSWRRPSGAGCGSWMPALPLNIQTWTEGLDIALFPSRVATVSLGVLGVMGAMLSITGIFGMAAYSVSKRLRELGIRIALGAQRKEVLAGGVGTGIQVAGFGFGGGIAARNSGQPGAGFHRVSGNVPAIRWYWVAWCWRCCCWGCGYVDSGAARAVGRIR